MLLVKKKRKKTLGCSYPKFFTVNIALICKTHFKGNYLIDITLTQFKFKNFAQKTKSPSLF